MSRKERLKVYHGVPKNTVDEYTLYYESFDENIKNISFEDSKYLSRLFKESYTGLCTNKVLNIDLGTFDLASNPFTIEFWIENLKSGCVGEDWGCFVGVGTAPYNGSNSANKIFSMLNYTMNGVNRPFGIGFKGTSNIFAQKNTFIQSDEPVYVRVIFDGVDTVKCYINGKFED